MIVHFQIHCAECGLPTLYPADTLQQPFAYPETKPNDALAVGIACHRCKSLDRYFLHKHHPDHNPRDSAFLLETRSGDTVHVSTLECEVEACKLGLPLYAYWNPATNEAERTADIATWRWDHLLCPEGHSIVKPKGWPTLDKPFAH